MCVIIYSSYKHIYIYIYIYTVDTVQRSYSDICHLTQRANEPTSQGASERRRGSCIKINQSITGWADDMRAEQSRGKGEQKKEGGMHTQVYTEPGCTPMYTVYTVCV